LLLKGFNDLASLHPQLALEWSQKNGTLLPEDVNERSTNETLYPSIHARKCLSTKLGIVTVLISLWAFLCFLPHSIPFAFSQKGTDREAKVAEVLHFLCKAKRIQLFVIRQKDPIALATEIKQAFAKANLFINSDSQRDVAGSFNCTVKHFILPFMPANAFPPNWVL